MYNKFNSIMIKSIKSSLFMCIAASIAVFALNLLAPSAACAQNTKGQLSGTVQDAVGPVIGAAVLIKGSMTGVTTDIDGAFTLNGLSINDVIVVSQMGYQTQEITYTGQTNLQLH